MRLGNTANRRSQPGDRCILILDRAGEAIKRREPLSAALADFRFDQAANALYTFIWGKVCDWYVEFAKPLFDGPEGMNRLHKVVFSRSLKEATWNNTTLIKGDLVDEIKKLKAGPGEGMVIMGSGTIVASARTSSSSTGTAALPGRRR